MDEAPFDLPPCRFCSGKIKQRVIAELDSVWAVRDRYPVAEGHHLIIPRRDGDTPHPRGGVRGVIPDKMSYPPT